MSSRGSASSAGPSLVGGERNRRSEGTLSTTTTQANSISNRERKDSRRLEVTKRPGGTRQATRRSLSDFKRLGTVTVPTADEREESSLSASSDDAKNDQEFVVTKPLQASLPPTRRQSIRTALPELDDSDPSESEADSVASGPETRPSLPAARNPVVPIVSFQAGASPAIRKALNGPKPATETQSQSQSQLQMTKKSAKTSLVSLVNNAKGEPLSHAKSTASVEPSVERRSKRSDVSSRDNRPEEDLSHKPSASKKRKKKATADATEEEQTEEQVELSDCFAPQPRLNIKKSGITSRDLMLDHIAQVLDKHRAASDNTTTLKRLFSAAVQHFGEKPEHADAQQRIAYRTKLRSSLKARRNEILKTKHARMELAKSFAQSQGSIEQLADQTASNDHLNSWVMSMQTLTEAAEKLKKIGNAISSNGINLPAIIASVKQRQETLEHVHATNQLLQAMLVCYDELVRDNDLT